MKFCLTDIYRRPPRSGSFATRQSAEFLDRKFQKLDYSLSGKNSVSTSALHSVQHVACKALALQVLEADAFLREC